jgi:hypothetical protein
VAWGLLFGHAAANTPVGPLDRIALGTAYSNRFPMTRRHRPSPSLRRVGSHIKPFGACSAFTTRCGLPARGAAERPFPSKAPAASLPPPPLRLLPAGANQLPGGDHTHGRPLPYHGAPTPPVPLSTRRKFLSTGSKTADFAGVTTRYTITVVVLAFFGGCRMAHPTAPGAKNHDRNPADAGVR